jgi:hypothetical protein
MKKALILILIIVMFIWGLLFVLRQPIEPEGFVSDNCQTTLIKDGNTIFLYDKTKASVPGVNPIKLKNLEEYKEYIKWQRANNIRCPILHLEKVYTTQGTQMYELRPNFITKNTDMGSNPDIIDDKRTCNNDSNLSRPPFNSNQYPGFDKENQTQGDPLAMTLALA